MPALFVIMILSMFVTLLDFVAWILLRIPTVAVSVQQRMSFIVIEKYETRQIEINV